MIFSKRVFPKFRILTNYIPRISKTQTESDPGAQMRLCLENNNLYLSWIFWYDIRYKNTLFRKSVWYQKINRPGFYI